jgi:hypothetical protein
MNPTQAPVDNCEYISKRSSPQLEKLDQWRNLQPVPYVGPAGEFEIRFIDLRMRNDEFKSQLDGLTPVHFENGTVSIARWARSVGYVLYEDLCKGRAESFIDGEWVLVDRNDGAWQAWLNYVRIMRSGANLPRSNPAPTDDGSKPVTDTITAKMYHPEIIRRRKQAQRGGHSTLSEERALQMILDTPEAELARASAGASAISSAQASIADQLDATVQQPPGRRR